MLESIGFDKTNFARFVGHKVSITGQLMTTTEPPTLRVSTTTTSRIYPTSAPRSSRGQPAALPNLLHHHPGKPEAALRAQQFRKMLLGHVEDRRAGLVGFPAPAARVGIPCRFQHLRDEQRLELARGVLQIQTPIRRLNAGRFP